MLTAEFNMDEALEVARGEGLEEGIEKGLEEGIEKGREEGRQEGKQEVIDLLKSGKSPEEILKDYE
ncbi:MAG: hypothetical protein FWH53_01155 [Leptospirales bacterium]|nr:hypothetical protein [Leptospirales bacterium]